MQASVCQLLLSAIMSCELTTEHAPASALINASFVPQVKSRFDGWGRTTGGPSYGSRRVRDERPLDLGTGWCQILHEALRKSKPAFVGECPILGRNITTPNRRTLSNTISRSDSQRARNGSVPRLSGRCCGPVTTMERVRTGKVIAVLLGRCEGACIATRISLSSLSGIT